MVAMGLPLPPLLEAFGCQKFGCENNYSHLLLTQDITFLQVLLRLIKLCTLEFPLILLVLRPTHGSLTIGF